MSKKKKKKPLHGMEHLYQDISSEASTIEMDHDNNINERVTSPVIIKKSHLKKELLIIIFIMIILFGILGVILYFDRTSDFMLTLAEKLTNLY